MASVERRISDLEAGIDTGEAQGFAEALRQGRLNAAGEGPFAETPITREMMDDPVHGPFYRLMHEARARVEELRSKDINNC